MYLANETLSAVVAAGGAWSVTAADLSDGPHRVVMRVSDAAGNRTGFTQMLTIDTVAPIVAITGGATATTSDVDPTITGTSDAAPGTTVTVTIAGQTMTTLLQANGTWNTTPTVVGEGTWPIVASAPDPAGNVGSAAQTLTIAPASPARACRLGRHRHTGRRYAADRAPTSSTPLVTPTSPAPSAGGPTSTVATTTSPRDADAEGRRLQCCRSPRR